MPLLPIDVARSPLVDVQTGHYESFYLKAADPLCRRAVWIRYTVHKRPHAQPTGSLWFTLFGAGAGRPYAVKVTLPDVRAGEGRYIEIGDSFLSPGDAQGSAEAAGRRAGWELELEPLEAPLEHLPHDWMYRAPLPRTKLASLSPYARVGGRVQFGGQELVLERWRGMVGHNWGAQHAERWIWVHAAGFAQDQLGWLDVALGRVRLGPVTTPWVANGALAVGGERTRLGGMRRVRVTEVRERPDGCVLTLSGKGLTVQALVRAEREQLVGWIYADPDGAKHNALNCSVADLELTVSRPGRPPLSLDAEGIAAYELGMRETDHGVPIEAFPDG